MGEVLGGNDMHGKDPMTIKCVICQCSFELQVENFFTKEDLACPNCGIDSRGMFKPFRDSTADFFEKKRDLHGIFEFDLGL
jgi:DNA-directed RNA polymerase subunit RPC12/RpoP